ncbi:MAG: hypothetical protein H7Z42_12010 [Roseiflexaceae bacterium]|nr:hypothetical protein [Roseiflexaceae bacterium]
MTDTQRVPAAQPTTSAIHQAVPAHVAAALVQNDVPYTAPVEGLLHLGDPREDEAEQRRAALGIGQEHVAELARMARDQALYHDDMEANEVWGPLHALQLLKTLDSSSVAVGLVPLLDIEDDWYDTLLPDLFGNAGPLVFEPLRAYLRDRTRWQYGHATAGDALVKLVEQHADLREEAVATLLELIEDSSSGPELRAFMISDLADLKAVEALPAIRRAFEADQIDLSIMGGWGDVQEAFGLTPDLEDALVAETEQRRIERHAEMFPFLQGVQPVDGQIPTISAGTTPRAKPGEQARKKKHKRKQEAASRKANRRKRK